jgi:4-hydroxybenzoate polyprenyltransferase
MKKPWLIVLGVLLLALVVDLLIVIDDRADDRRNGRQ